MVNLDIHLCLTWKYIINFQKLYMVLKNPEKFLESGTVLKLKWYSRIKNWKVQSRNLRSKELWSGQANETIWNVKFKHYVALEYSEVLLRGCGVGGNNGQLFEITGNKWPNSFK